MTANQRTPITAAGVDDERRARECTNFLYAEAELLDNRQFDKWLGLLSAGIDYRIPVRTTRLNKDGDGFSKTAYFMKEDMGSLKMRVAKLKSEYAWAENPATRTRHLISNVRVGAATVEGQPVTSNFAVYCFRGDSPTPLVLTGERLDILVREPEAFRLKRRLVLLDSTVLGLEALSIFL